MEKPDLRGEEWEEGKVRVLFLLQRMAGKGRQRKIQDEASSKLHRGKREKRGGSGRLSPVKAIKRRDDYNHERGNRFREKKTGVFLIMPGLYKKNRASLSKKLIIEENILSWEKGSGF